MVEVNREFAAKLVSDVREALHRIKELVSRPFEELGLWEKLALRYLIIELVEASAALCVHLLKRMYGIDVEGYPQCFLRLGKVGLIPNTLAERLARAARLRNLLVHRYWVIDDKKVYEAARTGLKDFEEYVSIVERVVSE